MRPSREEARSQPVISDEARIESVAGDESKDLRGEQAERGNEPEAARWLGQLRCIPCLYLNPMQTYAPLAKPSLSIRMHPLCAFLQASRGFHGHQQSWFSILDDVMSVLCTSTLLLNNILSIFLWTRQENGSYLDISAMSNPFASFLFSLYFFSPVQTAPKQQPNKTTRVPETKSTDP